VGVARCDTAEPSLFFGITVGRDENGIRDVDSVVMGTGTESGICNLVYKSTCTSVVWSQKFRFEVFHHMCALMVGLAQEDSSLSFL
jgi:hypothetical protein